MLRLKQLNVRQSLQWLLFAATVPFYVATIPNAAAQQTVDEVPLLAPADLEDLIAPVALYPDELLAIVLPASAYPLQIVEASRFLEARDQDDSLEPDPDWDDAVIALLNYREIIELMNDDLDWTWQLGEAVLAQQGDVLEAVESFRDSAFLAGNLVSDERQRVARNDEGIRITSAEPDVVYVPYYDPVQVVVRHDYPAFYYHDYGYPLYYYPYAASHRFNRGLFFGVSTAFAISWRHRYLHLNYFDHRAHPFFGRSFAGNRFYRHRSNRDYRVFAGNRRFSNRGNLYRWYPGRAHGARPRTNRYSARNDRRTIRYANAQQGRAAREQSNRRSRNERRNYRTFDNVVGQRNTNSRSNGRITNRRNNTDATVNRSNRRSDRATTRSTTRATRRSANNRTPDSRGRRSQDERAAAVTPRTQRSNDRSRVTTRNRDAGQTRRSQTNLEPAKRNARRAAQEPVKRSSTARLRADTRTQRSTRQSAQRQQRAQREQPTRQSQQRAQREQPARQSQQSAQRERSTRQSAARTQRERPARQSRSQSSSRQKSGQSRSRQRRDR